MFKKWVSFSPCQISLLSCEDLSRLFPYKLCQEKSWEFITRSELQMTNGLAFPSFQCCQFGLPPPWLQDRQWDSRLRPALSITSSKMNLFPLPISLHQGDSGGCMAWKNIPGNCRYFHFLPVVPIKMKFKKKKEPMKTEGMQLGLV